MQVNWFKMQILGFIPYLQLLFSKIPPSDLYAYLILRNCAKRLKVDVASELR